MRYPHPIGGTKLFDLVRFTAKKAQRASKPKTVHRAPSVNCDGGTLKRAKISWTNRVSGSFTLKAKIWEWKYIPHIGGNTVTSFSMEYHTTSTLEGRRTPYIAKYWSTF